MRRFRFPLRWYIALLIPPAMVLAVLLSLKTFASPVYAPNRFWIGVTFGILAGFLEEIRLDGFRLSKTAPTLRRSSRSSNPQPVLGTLARTSHRLPWLSLAPRQSLAGVFRGIRGRHGRNARLDCVVLRTHTKHPQLVHLSSTGALVVFSPPTVSPLQEATWYSVYAAALWLLVLLLTTILPPATQPTE